MKNSEQIIQYKSTQNKPSESESRESELRESKPGKSKHGQNKLSQRSSILRLNVLVLPSCLSTVFVLFCLLTAFFTESVFAAANDDISNTATISFVIGGVSNSAKASSTFKEDRLINFTVSKVNDGDYDSVIENISNAVMSFNIFNSGNGVQDFLLAASNTSPNPYSSPADNFDALTPMRVFVESGVTPGYQVGEDVIPYVDELAPNSSVMVYVLADMPAGIHPDDVAAVVLHVQVAQGGSKNVEGSAITNDDNGKTSPASPASGYSNGATIVAAGTASDTNNTLGLETVFNDPAGAQAEDTDSSSNQDVARNGQHADTGAYRVVPPVIIIHSVTVIDTDGNSEPRPTSTLRYQLDVSIAGSVSVANLVVNNPIPANTTYTDGTITLDGVSQTDIIDTAIDFSRAIDISSKPVTSIEVDLSQGGTVSVAPGTTHVITFDVTIN